MEAGRPTFLIRTDGPIRAAEILHWLRVFLTRFFANQFKRSTLPNGPKISSGGSLSPRGDWRAPSDANMRACAQFEELDAALSAEE